VDVGELIRKARYEAAFSQGELARRVGIAQSTLSALERGSRTPSFAMLQKVLAGTGHRLKLTLEPSDERIHRAADEIALVPPSRRPAVIQWSLLDRIEELPHRVEGMTAAAVLGAPIEVARFDMAVADDELTFVWLSRIMDRFIGRLRVPDWPFARNVQIDPEEMRKLIATECPTGDFEVSMFGVTAHARIRPPDEVAVHTTVETEFGTIPVQPIHEIEATDPKAARVLASLRDRQV
jgi:transcriptional regulator with XRE-family HTH domain